MSFFFSRYNVVNMIAYAAAGSVAIDGGIVAWAVVCLCLVAVQINGFSFPKD